MKKVIDKKIKELNPVAATVVDEEEDDGGVRRI